MEPHVYLYIGFFCFFTGALLSLFARNKERYLYLISTLGAVNFGIFGFSAIGGQVQNIQSYNMLPYLEFLFRVNPLSGFFILVVSILAFAVSIYSIGYTKDIKRPYLMGFLYNLFILSIYAVLLSANIFTFLVFWETMSIVSYFLVTFDRTQSASRAGLIYAVMTHIGTAFIIALFLILYKYTGFEDFEGMTGAINTLPSNIKTIVFLFALVGFGTKAGIIPLHSWLPRAHPAAPSNISALMSGVMIKTGVYGFLLIAARILDHPDGWWGVALIIIGAVSSVVGIMYALMEQDMKRLLAYSSVENMGIIMLGIGASLMFRTNGLHSLSSLALIAALYHTLNHAVFKGLLFLGAGSVLHASHTNDMEKMGGLLKTMPYTGLFFLIGSVSICALPPLNGFISEWLTYQALLLGFEAPSVTAKIISPLGGAALALTGAIASACYVKAFGISFLGLPRSSESMNVKESPKEMLIGMGILAVLCVALGVFPGFVVYDVLFPVVTYLSVQTAIPLSISEYRFVLSYASITPSMLLITMIFLFVWVLVFIYSVGGKKKVAYGDSWDCGMTALNARMQYSATAFTKPLKLIFKRIYQPRRELNVSYIVKPFFVKSIFYKGDITQVIEQKVYAPILRFIHSVARWTMALQSGSLHLYLGYILITLIVLLIIVRLG